MTAPRSKTEAQRRRRAARTLAFALKEGRDVDLASLTLAYDLLCDLVPTTSRHDALGYVAELSAAGPGTWDRASAERLAGLIVAAARDSAHRDLYPFQVEHAPDPSPEVSRGASDGAAHTVPSGDALQRGPAPAPQSTDVSQDACISDTPTPHEAAREASVDTSNPQAAANPWSAENVPRGDFFAARP